MRCVWVICESDIRWRRAVYTWGASALPSADDQISVIETGDIQAALTHLQKAPSAVAIWELPTTGGQHTYEAIETCCEAGHPQFVALHPSSSFGPREREAKLALRGLGPLAVLKHTVELYPWLPLISRHWQACRRQDNQSAIQQVWDRLPWQ